MRKFESWWFSRSEAFQGAAFMAFLVAAVLLGAGIENLLTELGW